jgi:hypothetical protein
MNIIKKYIMKNDFSSFQEYYNEKKSSLDTNLLFLNVVFYGTNKFISKFISNSLWIEEMSSSDLNFQINSAIRLLIQQNKINELSSKIINILDSDKIKSFKSDLGLSFLYGDIDINKEVRIELFNIYSNSKFKSHPIEYINKPNVFDLLMDIVSTIPKYDVDKIENKTLFSALKQINDKEEKICFEFLDLLTNKYNVFSKELFDFSIKSSLKNVLNYMKNHNYYKELFSDHELNHINLENAIINADINNTTKFINSMTCYQPLIDLIINFNLPMHDKKDTIFFVLNNSPLPLINHLNDLMTPIKHLTEDNLSPENKDVLLKIVHIILSKIKSEELQLSSYLLFLVSGACLKNKEIIDFGLQYQTKIKINNKQHSKDIAYSCLSINISLKSLLINILEHKESFEAFDFDVVFGGDTKQEIFKFFNEYKTIKNF